MDQEAIVAEEKKESGDSGVTVEPRCEYFGKCGGCRSQHIDYSVQVSNKKDLLARYVGIDASEIKVFSGDDFNYRNRMDFIVHAKGLGFRKKGQWDKIVDIDKCDISMLAVNKLLNEVREKFFDPSGIDNFDLHKQRGSFKYVVVRITKSGDSSLSFVLNSDSSRLAEAVEKVKTYASSNLCSAKNVLITYVDRKRDMSISTEYFVVKGSEFLLEELCGHKYYYSIQGFFQNNPNMAEKMIKYVRSLFVDIEGGFEAKDVELLDLYGGVGTFGIALADLFDKVFVVESFAPSIEIAQKNIIANELSGKVSAYVSEAKQLRNKVPLDILKHSDRSNAKKLFVVCDPPRSGMTPKAIRRLLELMPSRIVDISCNPKQLSKEILKFEAAGYVKKSVAMLDLFPQTNHMEGVVELILKES